MAKFTRPRRNLCRKRLSKKNSCRNNRRQKKLAKHLESVQRSAILEDNEIEDQDRTQVDSGQFAVPKGTEHEQYANIRLRVVEKVNPQQQFSETDYEDFASTALTGFDEASLRNNDTDEDGTDAGVNVIQETRIEGRCIADISYILDQLHDNFDNHNPKFDCLFSDLKLFESRRLGQKIKMVFQCEKCSTKASIWTDRREDETMDINRCATAGTIATGIGYSQMEEFFASMDIACMTENTYRAHQMEMCEAFERAAMVEMKIAAENARNRALEEGDFIIHKNEKIPFITVVADCSWMKRSYHTGKYDSLSGVGAITDYRTGSVLYRGVRNKFCAVCERAARFNVETNVHVCFKNWGRDQASTGMESDAIVAGFKQSVEVNGLIYKTLIADGDSSVYKSILDTNPYGEYQISVEKKECVNHLKRNLIKKIKEVAKTPGRKISHLKKLVSNSIKKLRNSIEMAVAYRKTDVVGIPAEDNSSVGAIKNTRPNEFDRAMRLKQDILNLPYHIFGDHRNCKLLKGFCNGDAVDGEQNVVEDLKTAGLFQLIETSITYLSFHAGSLLYDATNNSAEAFNAIVCKLIGGKRVNFGMRGSYNARCDGSVIQHNTLNILTKLHKSENKKPPPLIVRLEIKRQRKILRNAQIRRKQHLMRADEIKTSNRSHGPDKNYGPNAQRPDLPPDLYDELDALHNGRSLENQNNRTQIEHDTIEQADNALWQSLRRKMLTASNFGRVCRMRSTTSCSSLVQSILFPSIMNTAGMLWGRTNEKTAISALEKQLLNDGNPVKIKPCGLYIDPELEFLGASPDGVINSDSIVEIKCPLSAEKYTPDQAIQLNVSEIPKFFDKKDNTKMNKSHHYYYQVQGQLHVTRALYCYFAAWTPIGLKYVKVIRDDEFWKNNMEQQLIRFYNNCLRPEIIDSRYIRKLQIRDPQYIIDARQLAAQNKKKSDKIKDATTSTSPSRAAEEESRTEGYVPNEHKVQSRIPGKRPRLRSVEIIKRGSENLHSSAASSGHGGAHVVETISPIIMPLKLSGRDSAPGTSKSSETSEELSCMSNSRDKIEPIRLKKQGIQWVISPSQETDRTAPWVIVRDDNLTQIPTETEVQILESVNKQAPIADIRRDVLKIDSLLNDTSVDNFLDVVKRTSSLETNTTLWLTHARFIKPLRTSKDIQIIGGNAFRHWRCLYFDGLNLNIYDSLGCSHYESLKCEEKRYIKLRYPKLIPADITFKKVQIQQDNFSCGVFAAAFATTIALGGDPVVETYSIDVLEMRRHLLQIIESGNLTAFPSI